MSVPTAVPPEARARLTARFGPGAGPWCDALPTLVAQLTWRWGLVVRESGGGGTSRVFRCTRLADGRPLWLKLTPDPQVAAQEAAALAAWARTPAVVGMLEYDAATGALLLADVAPGTPLRGRAWRPAEVAQLLTALRGAGVPGGSAVPSPPAQPAQPSLVSPASPANLPSLRERVGFLFDLTRRRAPGAALGPARAAALDLAAAGPPGLVHGDLHAGNVLDGRDGLVAIDPRPSLGDPDFDLVDWVLEGAEDLPGLERRITELVALVPGASAERVLAWCRALAPLVAAPRAAAGRRDPQTVFLLELAAAG
ncbi:aminoglycoside phosphotransferase family protein [Kitasatospora sp. NPDC050543]|uniref:aminoglycoside phosphotransferase family protein n=1 Tax=Kitasatospora sp. NPDC050543 TaxID=3364054 RepID=UPI0037AF12E7